MKSRVRFLSSLMVVTLVVLLLAPSMAHAANITSNSASGVAQEGDCLDEIIAAVMEVTGIEDEDELIAMAEELEDEELEALLEEAGVADLAADCDVDLGEEISCEDLIGETLAVVTEIEDEDELVEYLEGLEDEELNALIDEAALLLAQAMLSDATGIEDLDELIAYLDELDEEEFDALLEEAGIYDIEEACADDDLEDLPEECLEDVFVVLVEETGIEDEDELIAYVDELDEEELDTLLEETGVYEIIEACEVDEHTLGEGILGSDE